MDKRDEDLVNKAKANRQTDTKRKSGAGRAQESATTAGNTLQEKLSGTRQQLAKTIKNQLVAGALTDVLEDFANGDFGNLADEMFNEFEAGLIRPLEMECQVLSQWQDSPKYALPPSQIPSVVESNLPSPMPSVVESNG